MKAKDALTTRSVHDRVVSVIIEVGDDADAALACIDRLIELDWPADLLEPVLVTDADSADVLRDLAATHHPKALVVGTAPRTSLAARRNAGAHAARGEYLAFLERDARPDAGWLREAMAVIHDDAHAAVVASKVLADDGTIAYVDAGLTFAGEPLLLHTGETDTGAYDRAAVVLFPSTWAFVVEARAFRYVGGFDAELCPGIEHVDLGWRLNLAGLAVRVAPRSVVRRATSAQDAAPAGDARVAMLAKNLDDANMSAAVAAALLLDDGTAVATPPGDMLGAVPHVLEARRSVQALRRVADAEILRLFRQPFASGSADDTDSALVRALAGIERVFVSRRKILVVTPDVLQPKMAGPAIRAYEMARRLVREHDVRLVSTVRCDLDDPELQMSRESDAGLRAAVAWADVVILQGHVIESHQWLRRSEKILVVDIYDPFHLEVLEQSRDQPPFARRHSVRVTVETINEQLIRGDFFMCASDKQRDFWLGQLTAVGRINPATYDEQENLDALISVVPFGVNDEAPVKTDRVLKGVVPGIGEDDKVVLWGGGVYNWFDPITLLHAIDKLRARLPGARLYFMGMRHPNPNVPAMQMAYRAQRLAEQLGLVGTHVFFNEGWVDYDTRQNYLLEADVGVSTHLDHIETAFSFRTRILDYLWASLPVVATSGDAFAPIIEQRGIGITVPPGDVDSLEAALHTLLVDEEQRAACRSEIEALVPELRWSKVVAPLLEFCRDPHRARDLVDPRQRVMLGDPMAQAMWGRTGWKHQARVALGHMRNGEWEDLSRKLRMRLRTYFDPSSAGPGARLD